MAPPAGGADGAALPVKPSEDADSVSLVFFGFSPLN